MAIALNMGYMFSSERFKTALYEFGPLHSNNDKAEIDKTALLANRAQPPRTDPSADTTGP